MYLSSPEYFGKYAQRFLRAGVRVLGGCCGTTPVSREGDSPRGAVAPSGAVSRPDRRRRLRPSRSRAPASSPCLSRSKSPLAAKIAAGQFVCSVEISPPKGADPTKALKPDHGS